MSIQNDSLNFTKEELIENVRRSFLEGKYDIIALYIPVFLAALIANFLVILVVIKNQYMRSVTNYFLVNLSVADLLVTLICMPESALKAYKTTYDLGRYPCKISSYLQCIAVTSSIFTITTMALDRYVVITKPLGYFYRCFNKKTTTLVIILLWTSSIILLLPMYIVVDLSSYSIQIPAINGNVTVNIELCHEEWSNFSLISREKMGVIWFIFIFAIPEIFLIFGYSMMGRTLCSVVPPCENDGSCNMQQRNRVIRSRKRVAIILLLLAFLFAVCWLPYHIMLLLFDINNAEDTTIKELNKYFLLLGHANSALNPIIYCALSKRFRNSIKDLFDIKIHFTTSKPKNSIRWADSNGSSTQLNYMEKLKNFPTNKKALSRLSSSQKTTRTCAV